MSDYSALNAQQLGRSSSFAVSSGRNQLDEDEKELLSKSNEEDGSQTSSDIAFEEMPRRNSYIRRFLLVQIALISLYTLLLVAVLRSGFNSSCSASVIYTPASDVGQIEAKTLHTHLFEANPFKGQPGPAIDAAWEDLFQNAYIRLSPDELQRVGRPSTPIQDGSGDFLGALDIYHQLHCINYIYQFAHPEYYQLNETNISTGDHVDHCIDMLRQVTMCRADTAVMTFSYQPDQPIAWPDFNMQHECRDWDAINAWAGSKGRVLDQSDPKRFHEMIRNPDYAGGKFDGHDRK